MSGSAASAKRILITGAVANLSGFAIQIVVGFVMSPLLVHGLGDRRYGIWSLVESIIAYLMLFDLGIAASVVRYVSRFEASNDRANLNRVYSTSFCLFAAAGLCALVTCCLFLGPLWGVLKVPPELTGEARWLLGLLAVNVAVGLPLGVFPSILDGLQKYPAKTAVRTGSVIVRSALLLAVLYFRGGLIPLALVLTACTVAENLVFAVLAYRYLPDLKFSFGFADRATLRSIRGYSTDAFLAMLAGRVSFQTDALVIAAFMAPEHITFFAVAARLVEYAKSTLRAVTTVLTPMVSGMEARSDDGAIRRVMTDGTRYVVWLILPIQLGFLILGKPFIALWMGREYAELSYPTLVILSLPLSLTVSQSVSGRILYGMGRLRWFSRVVIAEALLNLALSLRLISSWGIEGVAVGTAVPNLVCNVALAVYTCRILKIGVGAYAFQGFAKPLALASLPAAVWLAAARWAAPFSWSGLIIAVALGLAFYALPAVLVEFGTRAVVSRLKGQWSRFVWGKAAAATEAGSVPEV